MDCPRCQKRCFMESTSIKQKIELFLYRYAQYYQDAVMYQGENIMDLLKFEKKKKKNGRISVHEIHSVNGRVLQAKPSRDVVNIH